MTGQDFMDVYQKRVLPLTAAKQRERFLDLVQWCNAQGHRTQWGLPYVPVGRNGATIARMTYWHIYNDPSLGPACAGDVADVFVDKDYKHAWK